MGATVDQGEVNRAFSTAEKRAQKAHQTMQREQRKAAAAAEKDAQRKVRAEEKAARQIQAAAARVARAQLREQQKLVAASEALQRQRSAGLMAMYRAEERAAARKEAAIRRELEKTARAAKRAEERERKRQEGIQTKRGESFARRTSHRATRFLMPDAPIGSMAMRGLGEAVRGAGVDLSIGGGVQRSVELQSAATQLANQERIATGKTRGAGHYAQLGRRVGDQTFSDPGGAVELAARFAATTGTYDNLEEITPQLASLARASGAKFDEVGRAAGMVFQQMRDQPDAIQKTIDVMRTIIGQSAEGAVDMPDYASQLGRVAAGAFKFDGDRSRNVAALSALTQIAMERGATSAADAARSTSSFVSTLGKRARLDQFEAAGVRVYTSDTISDGTAVGADGKRIAKGQVAPGKLRTQLRPLEDIIKDSFRATNGDIPMLGRMYMDVLGRKGVESLGSAYQAAGGGEAGIDAIQAIFDRYMRATISKDVEKQNLKDVSDTVEARAQKFQNELDKVTDNIMSRFLPAIEKAGPAMLRFAEVIGRIATWAVENPKSAIAGAISLSIARAGLESTLRAGIERLLLGANNEQAGKLGKTVGAIGAVGTVAALGITTLQVMSIYADALYTQREEEFNKSLDASAAAEKAAKAAAKAGGEGDLEAERRALQLEIQQRGKAITARANQISPMLDPNAGLLEKLADLVGTGGAVMMGGWDDMDAANRGDAMAIAEERKALAAAVVRMAEVQAELASAMTDGITVKNMPGGNLPGRDSQQ